MTSDTTTTTNTPANSLASRLRIGQGGNDADIDRHGAAQPDPGRKRRFAPGVAERQQAGEHRDRPRQHDQHDGNEAGRRDVGHQIVRRDQQAEHQEQHDLRQPGEALRRSTRPRAGRDTVVAPVIMPAR